jgi:hypothetical protein
MRKNKTRLRKIENGITKGSYKQEEKRKKKKKRKEKAEIQTTPAFTFQNACIPLRPLLISLDCAVRLSLSERFSFAVLGCGDSSLGVV